MCQKIEAPSVDRLLRYDVSAVCRQRLNGIGDRRRSGSKGQGCASALKSSQPLFQHILGRIREPSVNIAGVSQAKSVSCVLAVVEDIGGCLIDRHGAGICGRICLLLSDV